MEANETNIQHLLDEVTESLEEFRRKSPPSFNVYDLCGVKHYETTHSAILAGLLKGNGNQEKRPLESFFRLFLDIKLTEEQLKNAEIKTEEPIRCPNGKRRRLDILITIGKDFCVVIENKVFTNDHSQQLLAYSNWLKEQEYKNKHLFYLTLYGTPSTEGCPKEKYTCLSYCEDILKWLEYTITKCNVDWRLYFALVQYKDFWEKWFMSINEAIIPVINSSLVNYESAKQIKKAFDGARKHLIKDTLQEWIRKKSFYCLDDVGNMSGGKFEHLFFAWNHRVKFGFEFTNDFGDLYYGVLSEEGQDKIEMQNIKSDDWRLNSLKWSAFKNIRDQEVLKLGENEHLCFKPDKDDQLFIVLDEAFEEMVSLLEQNELLFGKQSESWEGQVKKLRDALEDMSKRGELSPFTNIIEHNANETFLNGAKIGNHTFGISIGLHDHHVGFATRIWENNGNINNNINNDADFLDISDAMNKLPKEIQDEFPQNEFPPHAGKDNRYWWHKQIIPFDGIIYWLRNLQEKLKKVANTL